MSTIKSSAENLTLNADGANNDIIFQSNGSNVATLDQAGLLTATTFAGSGASLTGLTASQMPAGSVLQIVNSVLSAEQTSTSSTYADTGLTATMTCASSSNKILVNVQVGGIRKYGGNTSVNLYLQKDGSNWQKIGVRLGNVDSGTPAAVSVGGTSGSFLDAVGDTSAHTYKVQYSNRQNTGSVRVSDDGATSTITLMEIAG